ncbi:MAG: NADPH-dependent 7-cyano-7-deazaguanine reductase QueF [Gammaproteobacteria bacterium]
MIIYPSNPEQSELGKKSEYGTSYNPEKIFPIARKLKRDEIGISDDLPFFGFDLWNHYEVSWLNDKGKPIVAVAEISYNCCTPFIIESKSMKLYFNSFNNSKFKDITDVEKRIKTDLESRLGGEVNLKITPLQNLKDDKLVANFQGTCIDDLDVECFTYLVDAEFLTTKNDVVEETLYSNLLKSNCLVTNQPDWASVQIHYKGKQIDHTGLLRYLVSFRNHNEFHEQCIERIFVDIMKYCQPEELTVYGRYTRRGGLDINPYRSTQADFPDFINFRLVRQ